MISTREGDKLLDGGTPDGLQSLSLREQSGKRVHKVEFNFDTGSQDGKEGSLGGTGVTHSELPT